MSKIDTNAFFSNTPKRRTLTKQEKLERVTAKLNGEPTPIKNTGTTGHSQDLIQTFIESGNLNTDESNAGSFLGYKPREQVDRLRGFIRHSCGYQKKRPCPPISGIEMLMYKATLPKFMELMRDYINGYRQVLEPAIFLAEQETTPADKYRAEYDLMEGALLDRLDSIFLPKGTVSDQDKKLVYDETLAALEAWHDDLAVWVDEIESLRELMA